MEIEHPLAVADKIVVAREDAQKDSEGCGLSGLGTVRPAGMQDLLVVELRPAPEHPKEGWSAVLTACADALWAAPVMRDARGEELLPTGSVVVRFRSRPAPKRLERFAASHALRIERRNEYVPEQIVFRPASPRSTYLPDLVERLANDPDVATAWASTASQYRRA